MFQINIAYRIVISINTLLPTCDTHYDANYKQSYIIRTIKTMLNNVLKKQLELRNGHKRIIDSHGFRGDAAT